MLSVLPFQKIPGFSKLFLDFIEGNSFFEERFPFNTELFKNKEELMKRGMSIEKRKLAIDLILESSKCIELNEKQRANIAKLELEHTFCIITGQQVGFLGGPLYTFYKTASSIQLTLKLKIIYPELNFIPVFWIEDNDHDNFEASHIKLLDRNYEMREFSCSEKLDKTDRTPVSELKFDSDINRILNDLCDILTETEHKQAVLEFLNDIYQSDKNWNDAFIQFLNKFFAKSGLMYVKASEVRKSGLWNKLILKELSEIGKSDELVKIANQKLLSAGYHIQAKSSLINLFLHDEDKRFKIEVIDRNGIFQINGQRKTLSDLLSIVISDSSMFSPNVLLRPVFQDYVLPNLAYIGGPSEIGYSSQIKELYEYFDVCMPAFFMRHSATVTTQKISSFLDKNNLDIGQFMKPFIEIEKEINEKLFDRTIESQFRIAEEKINEIFDELKNISKEVDKTLEGTANAALAKSLQQIEILEKKVNAAQKRNHSVIYNQYRQANTFIFPEHALQERIFSVVGFVNQIGFEGFGKLLNEITKQNTDSHIVLNI